MKKALVIAAVMACGGVGYASAQETIVIEVPNSARNYVIAHPVDPVPIEGDVQQGYVMPETVVIHPIPDNPDFGYVYVNGQPVIVVLESRQVVYYGEAPNAGPAIPRIPDTVITYIENNPIPPVEVSEELNEGMIVPDDVPLGIVPDQPAFSYVYVNDQPVLVETQSRRIVWME